MRSLRLLRTIALLALSATATAACGGAGFDTPEKIKGLRILAVQKDKPYPKPGEEVTLKLLYWDGKAKEGSPRNLEVDFFPKDPKTGALVPCVNPTGDLYYGCYKDILLGGLLSPPSRDSGLEAGSSLTDGGVEADPSASNEGGADASEMEAATVDASTFPDGFGWPRCSGRRGRDTAVRS